MRKDTLGEKHLVIYLFFALMFLIQFKGRDIQITFKGEESCNEVLISIYSYTFAKTKKKKAKKKMHLSCVKPRSLQGATTFCASLGFFLTFSDYETRKLNQCT